MKHQYHYGKKFYLDKKTGYWISTTAPRIRAHVHVWNFFYGTIPKGFHIHHIDENKSNNDISNLTMITAKDHISYHSKKTENVERSRRWCKIIRPLTKDWHASEKGRKWHIEHAKKYNFGNWEKITYNCDQCHKTFESKKRSNTRFCCNACKSKWRRDQKIDHIEYICEVCNIKFKACKYKPSKTCGFKCGRIFKSKID